MHSTKGTVTHDHREDKYFCALLKAASKVETNEIKAVFLSFSFAFTLMASYYVLRPMRDAMASDWSDAELSTLFTATFVFSFIAVAFYGAACSRIKVGRLVPGSLWAVRVVFFRVLCSDSSFAGRYHHWQGFLHLDQYFQPVPCVCVLELHG